MLLFPKKGFTWHEGLFFLKMKYAEDWGEKMSGLKSFFFSLNLPKGMRMKLLSVFNFIDFLTKFSLHGFSPPSTYLKGWWGIQCFVAARRTKATLCSRLTISLKSSSLYPLAASYLGWFLPWSYMCESTAQHVCSLYQRSGSHG